VDYALRTGVHDEEITWADVHASDSEPQRTFDPMALVAHISRLHVACTSAVSAVRTTTTSHAAQAGQVGRSPGTDARLRAVVL
jgi:hypothetical protein